MNADRYFARFTADDVPYALLRRHFDDDGFEDQVLRDVDDWRPEAHGTVSRAILAAIESDLAEITPEQADEILQMVAERRYAPLAPSTGTSSWEAQGCPACRRRWESGRRPRFIDQNTADHSALYRCDDCGTWWLLTERYAVAVEPDRVRDVYGDHVL